MSRNYLEAFAIILIAVGVGFFLVLPKYNDLQATKMKIAEKNTEIENRQEYFAALSQAAIELSQYEANLEKIESAFPTSVDAPALMNFTQTAAMQSGLIVKAIGYSGSGNGAIPIAGNEGDTETERKILTLSSYPVEGEFIGSYNNFKDFLARLEFSSRLIAANTIEINSSQASEAVSSSKSGGTMKGASTIDEEAEMVDPILNFKVKLTANYYKK